MGELIGLAGTTAPFLMVCFIVWTKHQRKMAEMQVGNGADQATQLAAQYASQNRALEDRVRVLERIVTDKGYDLGSQIEALREPVAIAAPRSTGRDSAL